MSHESLFLKLAKAPLRLVPPTTVTRILRGRLRGARWITGASFHAYWLGTFETGKRLLFERTIRPGQVVFDIGANVGYYTLLASSLVGKHGKVYAFEPLSENLIYLRQHLVLNNISNVEVIEAAVADVSGTGSFDPGLNRSMGHLTAHSGFPVRVVSLDDLIENEQLPAPDCLKIDVEGAEARVLRGALGVLSRHPKIFLATHGNTLHDECLALLESFQYSIRVLAHDRAVERGEIYAG